MFKTKRQNFVEIKQKDTWKQKWRKCQCKKKNMDIKLEKNVVE